MPEEVTAPRYIFSTSKEKTTRSPGSAKIKDLSPPPTSRGRVANRETIKNGHTSRQPAQRPAPSRNSRQTKTNVKAYSYKTIKRFCGLSPRNHTKSNNIRISALERSVLKPRGGGGGPKAYHRAPTH